MPKRFRPFLSAAIRFVRTSSLARAVLGLLALAMVLLLLVNLTVFVMVQRTVDFNQTVEHSQQVRLTAQQILTRLVDAETGQRGYLLTAQSDYLTIHDEAIAEMPGLLTTLSGLTVGDPVLSERVDRIRSLSRKRLTTMERSITMANAGRIGEAVSVIRTGEGKVLMDQMRAEISAIDTLQATRIANMTQRSERGAKLTLAVNAVAMLLILLLALVIGWMVRRYVGEIQGARDIVHDLNAELETKVRDRTYALSRANEEIQRFAYIVSHDLRAPLVNVMGYTAELEEAGRTIDRQMTAVETVAPQIVEQDALTAVRDDMPEAIGFIRASTAKMDRLINAILKLSREGRRSLVPEVLDMSQIAQAIADSVHHQTADAHAEIIIEALPPLESDRMSIEQIFGNLVDNAVKYLEPSRSGRIVVSGEADGPDWITYRVSDNGRGVSERDHERVFELFRRAGRQDRPGEGLGLAFVRNSVRRLGGVITLESELGEGSVFTLKFPTRLVTLEAGETE
ncbi:MAG TPA: CHASE3 domain-containing protein [Brevundimonas sp.]|nr:CHASE3 domain-containing protein [Brevundimonas sp.]